MRLVFPISSIGWHGGDVYVDNIKQMFISNNLSRIIRKNPIVKLQKTLIGRKLLEFRLFQIVVTSLYVNSGLNIPWPLGRKYGKKLHWIPDLQDLQMPDMFSEHELSFRENQRLIWLGRDSHFYFSSAHAKDIFSKHYPAANIAGVFNFSVWKEADSFTIPMSLECQNCSVGNFVYLPNQWWKHKNHLFVLTAFLKILEKSKNLHLILSGPMVDERWPNLRNEISSIIEANSAHIHNLKMVSDDEKNWLFKEAKFVMQPSMYEGWSTTIEEAIFFNKTILASNIEPNVEQTLEYPNSFIFNLNSDDDFIRSFNLALSHKIESYDYETRRNRSLMQFKKILGYLSQHSFL